jgi:nicotinamidase-related amidase
MIRQLVKPRRRQVLIDVSTQRDYFLAQGSACIRNHRHVLANVRRMMAWARRKDIPVISTCEVYPNNNGHSDPGYCIDGTWGQRKISYSMLSRRASFPANSANELPGDILRRFQQVILHNRCSDPFEEPRIDRLLTEILASEFIVIGACAEGAVEAVVLGLLQRGKRVAVVCDAVGSHDKREGKMAFRKMRAKGAKLVETRHFAGKSHLKVIGMCDCKLCKPAAEKMPVNVG